MLKFYLPLAYFRLRGVMLQEYFFREALSEIGVLGGRVKIDHMNGRSFHEATGWVPIVFPMRLVDEVRAMSKTKSRDYYFQGVISRTRKWLAKYPGVVESFTGRNKFKKYKTDYLYYERLCATRFALCPTGDCPWSYRFFEAVMCKSIPVIGDGEIDVYAAPFFFYRDSDEKTYSDAYCDENFRIFLERHTLKLIAK